MDHDHIQARNVAERYVAGRLSEAERAAFEAHLVDCAECVDQVELAEAFRAGLTAAGGVPGRRVAPRAVADATRRRWWPTGLALGAALAVIVVAGGATVLRRLADARSELESAHRTMGDLERRAAGVTAELEAERAARAALAGQLEELSRLESAQVYTLASSRGASEEPDAVVRLPRVPGWIVFSVEVGDFAEYRARLEDDTGRVRWESDALRSGSRGTLTFGLRSTLLQAGDLRLRVDGVTGNHRAQAAQFRLRVVHP